MPVQTRVITPTADTVVTMMTTSVSPLASTLPAPLQQRIHRELAAGERVVWASQPLAGKSAKQSAPIFLFGIPWTAFAVFWTWHASNGLALFGLFGLPFIAIGLLMLSAPWWAARGSARSAYVITDRRALSIVHERGNSVVVRSYVPSQLSSLARTEADDGSGSITYGEGNVALFSNIADVARVERHLINLIG
jgi:hypothetical protein